MTPHLACLCAILAAALYGGLSVPMKIALEDVQPSVLMFYRAGFGALILFGYLALAERRALRVKVRDLPRLVLPGILFTGIFALLYSHALVHMDASRAVLILATTPLWSGLLSLGRERLGFYGWAGVVAALGGVYLIMGEPGSSSLLGIGLMCAAALANACFSVVGKGVVKRYSSLTMTAYGLLAGSLVLLPTALGSGLLESGHVFQGETPWLLGIIVLIGGVVAPSLKSASLAGLSPTRSAIFVNLNAPFSLLVASVFLGETLTFNFAFGVLAVALSVYLVNTTRAANKPQDRLGNASAKAF